MEQLVNQITTRTGISEQQARDAINMVAGFLKDKLPAPIASQVDAALSGQHDDMLNQAQQHLGGLGGLFNK